MNTERDASNNSEVDIEQLSTEWSLCTTRLEQLGREADAFVCKDQDIPDQIDRQTDELFQRQAEIMSDLLNARATTIDAVYKKLLVWLSHNFGYSFKPEQMQTSDLLVFQAIRELDAIRGRQSTNDNQPPAGKRAS